MARRDKSGDVAATIVREVPPEILRAARDSDSAGAAIDPLDAPTDLQPVPSALVHELEDNERRRKAAEEQAQSLAERVRDLEERLRGAVRRRTTAAELSGFWFYLGRARTWFRMLAPLERWAIVIGLGTVLGIAVLASLALRADRPYVPPPRVVIERPPPPDAP